MRQKITFEAIKQAAEGDAELFNKELEASFKDEVDERKKAIEGRVPFVLSAVPRPSELAEGVIVVGRDGTTFKLYAKCSDGVVRGATITP